MKNKQVRSSLEKGIPKIDAYPPTNYNSPYNYNPYNYSQPHSIHHDRSDDDNQRGGRYPPSHPYPINPYAGFGMPQFIPVFMPMGGYPGMGPYPGPYLPHQYNYGAQYEREVDPDEVEFDGHYPRKVNKIRTAEEIINEFKARTLPRLHMSRLVKMQALMRGHYVRRFKMPRIRKMDKCCKLISYDLLNIFIEDKFIPDLALEIITMNKYERDYTMHEAKTRAKLEYIDGMLDKVVRDMARDAARETANNLAYEYNIPYHTYLIRFLKMKKGEPLVIDSDPFSNCAKDVLHNYVAKISETVAREAVREMVMEYLMEAQLNTLLKTRYIPKIAEIVAHDAVLEVAIEEIMNDKIGSMVEELAPAMIDAVHEELVAEATDKELERAAKNHVRRLMMDALLDNLRAMVISKAGYEDLADSVIKDGKQLSYMDDMDGLAIQDK